MLPLPFHPRHCSANLIVRKKLNPHFAVESPLADPSRHRIDGIHTPAELMAVSLRPALQSLAPKLPSTLNEFLRLSGSQLSELGTMTVKERRYLLWLREKFRCACPSLLFRMLPLSDEL